MFLTKLETAQSETAYPGLSKHQSENYMILLSFYVIQVSNMQAKTFYRDQQKKVVKEKRKNVHAGILGRVDDLGGTVMIGTEVTYNPYKYNSFVDKNTEYPIYYSGFATLTHNKVLTA